MSHFKSIGRVESTDDSNRFFERFLPTKGRDLYKNLPKQDQKTGETRIENQVLEDEDNCDLTLNSLGQ